MVHCYRSAFDRPEQLAEMSAGATTRGNVASAWHRAELGRYASLFQQPVDAVSLDIFNYWFSTKPIDPLWTRGQTYSEAAIRHKIQATSAPRRSWIRFALNSREMVP
jgi:hypothetical protein